MSVSLSFHSPQHILDMWMCFSNTPYIFFFIFLFCLIHIEDFSVSVYIDLILFNGFFLFHRMVKSQLTIFLNEHLGYFQYFPIIINNVFIECIYSCASVEFLDQWVCTFTFWSRQPKLSFKIVGEGRIGGRSSKVQNSRYQINKSQGCDVQHDDCS